MSYFIMLDLLYYRESVIEFYERIQVLNYVYLSFFSIYFLLLQRNSSAFHLELCYYLRPLIKRRINRLSIGYRFKAVVINDDAEISALSSGRFRDRKTRDTEITERSTDPSLCEKRIMYTYVCVRLLRKLPHSYYIG